MILLFVCTLFNSYLYENLVALLLIGQIKIVDSLDIGFRLFLAHNFDVIVAQNGKYLFH